MSEKSRKGLNLKTVPEIVQAWLENKGFDGLCNGDLGCGCRFENFMPCDEPCMHECRPAFSFEWKGEFDFMMMDGATRAEAKKKLGRTAKQE